MNYKVIIAAVLLTFTTSIYSASNESINRATKLLSIMKVDDLIVSAKHQIKSEMFGDLFTKNTSQQFYAKILPQMDKIDKILENSLEASEIEKKILNRIYGQFNDKEIKELLTFFQSAVGEKYIAVLPILQRGIFLEIQSEMKKNMDKIKPIVEEIGALK